MSQCVGGTGADSLRGGGGDDILIGGRTAHDASAANLALIHKEWTSSATFAMRRDHLLGVSGGSLAGAVKLKVTAGATVTDDGAAGDTLRGEAGTDWFFAHLSDLVIDLGTSAGETLTGIA